MFHYMDAKIRRGGCLLSPDGNVVDLRSPEQIRADKDAEIQAVVAARQHYVNALTGLYNVTAQKGAPGSPVKTFAKVQYFIGKNDERVATGYIPGDNVLGYNFGFTTRLVPSQVRSNQYPTIRPFEKSVYKEIQQSSVKTYTHFTFPDGPYGFTSEGDDKYSASEQWSSDDGYTSGRIQGGGGVFIGGIRYDLTGGFPADETTYSVECARTVLRQYVNPSRYADWYYQDNRMVQINDEWSIKDMLDIVTYWQTPRDQPDLHPETDYRAYYNEIDKFMLEYRRSRSTDWFRIGSDGLYIKYGGVNATCYGEQFTDGSAIYYYSEMGIGLALYQSGVVWPDSESSYFTPWTIQPWGSRPLEGGGLAPCRPVNLLTSDTHYHKAYIRGVDGAKLNGSFVNTGYWQYFDMFNQGWQECVMVENHSESKGVFIVDGVPYEMGARYRCALSTDNTANHILRPTSAGVTPTPYPRADTEYDPPFAAHSDVQGVVIAEPCLRVHWSGLRSEIKNDSTPPSGNAQYIPFVTMYVNGILAPVAGYSRSILVPPGTQVTFIPGGEDFTGCVSQKYAASTSLNAHGAALYSRTDGEYCVDVLTFSDQIGSVRFPVYRTPEKLLDRSAGSFFFMDYAIVATAYNLPYFYDNFNARYRYYVNLYPTAPGWRLGGGGEYGSLEPWPLGTYATPAAKVTPTVNDRVITCDLPQGWIAYLSKRQRAGAPANAFQHVGEGPCGNTNLFPTDRPQYSGDTTFFSDWWLWTADAVSTFSRPDQAGSISPLRLMSPCATELPRPVNNAVTIPDHFVGDWFLQIVDTYYCVMLEVQVNL